MNLREISSWRLFNNDIFSILIAKAIIKTWAKYLLILALPIILMITVNEISRAIITEPPHVFNGQTAINSRLSLKEKCTWTCHYNTDFCKANHVRIDSGWFPTTDKAYYGIIHLLDATTAYNFMNVFMFLFLIPLVMWWLFVKSLRIQSEIKRLKKAAND